MQPGIHVITLAVHDLERSLVFYREGLGFDSPGVIGTQFAGDETDAPGAAVMFRLDGDLILALYPRSSLAKDADVPLAPAKTGEFSIGHIVGERSEVDAVLAQAQAAGATVTAPPRDRPWGIYSGYFRDPDGHLWEIIWSDPSRAAESTG
jgi:catechol 2,3-dioxygenase-like lactoylglutathione lyase family enzyme